MLTGAALATINRIPVLLLPSGTFATRVVRPGAPGARAAVCRGRHRQRRVPAVVPLLRPGQPARAAALRAARRDAHPHRPGGDRRRDHRAAAGRAGGGLRLAGRAVRRAHLAHRPTAGRGRPHRRCRRGDPVGATAADRGRRRRALLGRRGGAAPRSARRPASRWPRPRPARARCCTATPSSWAPSARPARRPPTRWPPRPTSSSGSARGGRDFTTASRTAFRHHGVRFVNVNVAPVDASSRPACRWSPTPARPCPR